MIKPAEKGKINPFSTGGDFLDNFYRFFAVQTNTICLSLLGAYLGHLHKICGLICQGTPFKVLSQ